MEALHNHLLINHLPIILPAVALMLFIANFIFRSEVLKRAGYMILIFSAVFAFLAMQTGEGAEEYAEHEISGVSHEIIEEHEEKSIPLMIGSILLGVLSLAGMFASMRKKSFGKGLGIVVVTLNLALMYFAYEAGSSGGKIRRPELRENGTESVSTDEESVD